MIIDKSCISRLELEPADIGAVRGGGPAGFASRNLFVPRTDRFHHFLVWMKRDGDYIILESIGKGLSVGRLSMYSGKDVRFYRAGTLDLATRRRACEELTEYGRSRYDWALYLRLAWDIAEMEARIVRSGQAPRRLSAEELPYRDDAALVCTEAVVTAFRLVNWSLVPRGVLPLPSAIEQARLSGLLKEVRLGER
jgi:hypothetical protein